MSLPTTCDLSDDHPDARVVVADLRDFGGREAFAGEAVVVRCHDPEDTDPGVPDNTLVKQLCGTPGEGRVLVVDAGALLGHAVLGDLIAADAVAHGWSGLLVVGAVRDVEILRTLDLGVKALGAVPRKSVRRGLGARDTTCDLGGVTIASGDHVYADATGVLVSSTPLV